MVSYQLELCKTKSFLFFKIGKVHPHKLDGPKTGNVLRRGKLIERHHKTIPFFLSVYLLVLLVVLRTGSINFTIEVLDLDSVLVKCFSLIERTVIVEVFTIRCPTTPVKAVVLKIAFFWCIALGSAKVFHPRYHVKPFEFLIIVKNKVVTRRIFIQDTFNARVLINPFLKF